MKSIGKIVVPGELICRDSRRAGENTLPSDVGVISTQLGVIQQSGKRLSIIPYSGPYKPKKGELIVGMIVGYAPNGWFVDIGAGSKAFLPASEVFKVKFDPRIHELKEKLKIGDVITAKVLAAERLGAPLLTLKGERNLGKMNTSWFIKVPVVKIARIIGKRGSMLKILEEKANCKIIVGQNGVIAIQGPYESYVKVRKAIDLISEKTFVKGLTELVSKMLSGENKK